MSKYTGVGGGARLHTHVKDKRRITEKSTVIHLTRRWLKDITKADIQLMADAPALLAEVKRLREELALYRQGVIDATLMYPHLYNYLPLYLRELIE